MVSVVICVLLISVSATWSQAGPADDGRMIVNAGTHADFLLPANWGSFGKGLSYDSAFLSIGTRPPSINLGGMIVPDRDIGRAAHGTVIVKLYLNFPSKRANDGRFDST